VGGTQAQVRQPDDETPAAPLPAGAAQAVVPSGSRYLNRELSLLDYNTRVLARAEDASLPLLDRVRSLHFFGTNLDDFFQIRVAGLKEQLEAAPLAASPDGLSPMAQLRRGSSGVTFLIERLGRRVSKGL